MQENLYEILSLGARYWFAFLGLMIVWRAFKWLRKDRRAKHRRLKQLPDAGMIGEMVVLSGSDELPEGMAVPVPREGTLGFLRTCDMVIPVEGVCRQHIDFTFQDGKGLLLFPLRGCECIMDGTPLTHRTKSKKHPMHHGSRLQVGEAVLRLRLFAGLETEQRSQVLPLSPMEAMPQPFEDAPAPVDWQDSPYVYHQVPASWQDTTGSWQPVEPWREEAPIWREEPQPWTQEQPWPEEAPAWPQEQPWTPPQEDFAPAQARRRQRRFVRRHTHEE